MRRSSLTFYNVANPVCRTIYRVPFAMFQSIRQIFVFSKVNETCQTNVRLMNRSTMNVFQMNKADYSDYTNFVGLVKYRANENCQLKLFRTYYTYYMFLNAL